jgi:hypothetical protein
MSDPPSKSKRDKTHEARENADSLPLPEPAQRAAGVAAPTKPIVILAERDIPFEEERPPNFSPHFQVRVHRTRRREKPPEVET